MKSFPYKDSFVAVRSYSAGKTGATCFCCNKPVEDCQSVLLLNNHRNFPNMLLHEDCFHKEPDPAALCDRIKEAYEQYHALDSLFG